MKRDIHLLIPSLHPTGPVKGAVALANAIVPHRRVTLVALKGGPGPDAAIDDRVSVVSLARHRRTTARAAVYRRMLRDAGGRARVASISMLFSADAVNAWCRSDAATCASIRGNLFGAYSHTYGLAGFPFAFVHLTLLRRMDSVVAMTRAMAQQITRYSSHTPAVIGNFVDEEALEHHRDRSERHGPFRIVFVGFLSVLKQTMLLLDAFAAMTRNGVDARLDIVGDGDQRSALEQAIAAHRLGAWVTMHGHLREPYPIVARADVMAIPSRSEGLSRAALEALHLGVPCVLRDADGNAELIRPGVNGVLFQDDDSLAAALMEGAKLGRIQGQSESLLPTPYRQHYAAGQYLDLVDSL